MPGALLKKFDYTSSLQPIEGPRGWANVLGTARRYEEITKGLGAHYEITVNTYKPFPRGILIHPALDACLQLGMADFRQFERAPEVLIRVRVAHVMRLKRVGTRIAIELHGET